MDEQQIAELAERFLVAEATRTPIEVPSRVYPQMTVADGYRVQRAIVARKLARGDRLLGKKVGLTSRANQEVFGVREPVYGPLLASGLRPPYAPVDTAALIQPILECELAFVLRRRLEGPGVTLLDVLRATEGVMPALELGDSRMRDWIGRAKACDILADSCGNAGVICGGTLVPPHRLDLATTGVLIEKNGELLATAATGAVMGHPAQAVAWLANKLAEVEQALEEGELVLSGAVAGAIPMRAGDHLQAMFGSGLGAIGVTFR